MYRIALNTAITHYRKGKTTTIEFQDSIGTKMIDCEDPEYERNENMRLLHRAISKLSKAEKAVIILYMDDYPYEEIAEIIGISVSNVGVKINRIKKKLKTFLKELGYGL